MYISKSSTLYLATDRCQHHINTLHNKMLKNVEIGLILIHFIIVLVSIAIKRLNSAFQYLKLIYEQTKRHQ